MKIIKVLFIFIILTGILTGCGMRTVPKPYKEKLPDITEFTAIQRGNQIRLSWKLPETIDFESQTPIRTFYLRDDLVLVFLEQDFRNEVFHIRTTVGVSQQFMIEETVLNPQCLECLPLLSRNYLIPYPSRHLKAEKGHIMFYLPEAPKDPYVHSFKLFFKTRNGRDLATPQQTKLNGFTEFPELTVPKLKLMSFEQAEGLRQLVAIPVSDMTPHVFQISWEPLVEQMEVLFDNTGEILTKPVYFRANIYRAIEGYNWPETPIATISNSFLLMYQPQPGSSTSISKPELPQREAFLDYFSRRFDKYLFQIRLVDSHGNESLPSPPVYLYRHQEPALPETEELKFMQDRFFETSSQPVK
ncbi:MAG: hypothetical protein HQM12_09035 [SAR324 cluster bacterium]|nr:hypothetical protein [SAR324 cluster bacterium]